MSDTPSETELSERVAAFFTAIAHGDVDTARALSTADGWTTGDPSPKAVVAQVAAEQLLLQPVPMNLTVGSRSAIRATGFRKEGAPLELWFLFEADATSWWCAGVLGAQTAMQQWMLGEPIGHRAERPAAPPAPPQHADVDAMLATLCAALAAGNPDPVKALTRPDRWGGTDRSNPARYFKKAQRGSYEARVVRGPFVGASRAVAQLGIVGEHGATDRPWVILERWAPGKVQAGKWAGDTAEVPKRWVWTAVTHSEAGAALMLHGLVDSPAIEALPEVPSASRFLTASLTASEPPKGSAEAWSRLVTREQGYKAVAGDAHGLPALGRALAAIEIRDGTTVRDTRWAVLERVEGEWTVRGISFLASLDALVQGAGITLPDQEDDVARDEETESRTRSHVESAFLEVLASKGIARGDDGQLDFSKAKKEDVEGMLPELVSSTFGALFESIAAPSTADKATADKATAEPTPIDLAAERAKRTGPRVPTAAEEELSENVKGALGKVVARAAASKDGNLKVDADFVKDHGGELMGALFGAIAQSLVPKGSTSFKVDVPDDAPPGDDAPEAAPADAPKKKKQVDVNLDLGSLFGGLIEQAVTAARAESQKQKKAPPPPVPDDEE